MRGGRKVFEGFYAPAIFSSKFYELLRCVMQCGMSHNEMAEEDESMEEFDSSTQWLVERARQSLKENNPYEAKAWLITAKTLYPKDFGVQVIF